MLPAFVSFKREIKYNKTIIAIMLKDNIFFSTLIKTPKLDDMPRTNETNKCSKKF